MSATVLISTNDNQSHSQNPKANPASLQNKANSNPNNAPHNPKRYKKKMGFNTDVSEEE